MDYRNNLYEKYHIYKKKVKKFEADSYILDNNKEYIDYYNYLVDCSLKVNKSIKENIPSNISSNLLKFRSQTTCDVFSEELYKKISKKPTNSNQHTVLVPMDMINKKMKFDLVPLNRKINGQMDNHILRISINNGNTNLEHSLILILYKDIAYLIQSYARQYKAIIGVYNRKTICTDFITLSINKNKNIQYQRKLYWTYFIKNPIDFRYSYNKL